MDCKLPKILFLSLILLLSGCLAPKEFLKVEKNISSFDGKFILYMNKTDNATLNAWKESLEQSKFYNGTINTFNANIAIPYNISVIVTECGEANGKYLSKNKEIVVCYELLADAASKVNSTRTEEEKDLGARRIARFALYHEISHALIDVLELPFEGKEEDAADQLGTVLIIQNQPTGDLAARDASDWLFITAEKENADVFSSDDDYSSPMERFENIYCMVYGSNITKFSYIKDDGYLPGKIDNCENDYLEIREKWVSLLEQYSKKK